MKGLGRRFVVDADIGCGMADATRAMRGATVDARAMAFYEAAEALYDARHVVVFTPEVWAEWDDHVRSRSSGRRWLARMLERKLLIHVDEPDRQWLDAAIREHLGDGDREVAQKDAHVVAAAISAADQRLLSGDGKARDKFKQLVSHEPRLGSVHWVHPTFSGVRDWLLERAPDRPGWTLGGAR